MITVNVWLPRKTETGKNVGHASMEVAGRAYVSWWPDEAAGLGSKHYPIRNKSFASDIRDEYVQPDWRIRLSELEENRVQPWQQGNCRESKPIDEKEAMPARKCLGERLAILQCAAVGDE